MGGWGNKKVLMLVLTLLLDLLLFALWPTFLNTHTYTQTHNDFASMPERNTVSSDENTIRFAILSGSLSSTLDCVTTTVKCGQT